MTILQEIMKWSQTLPAWQQDAIARLYVRPELSAQDFEDLYALLKSLHGIPDPKGRIPTKLAAEQVAAPQAPDQLVQLTAIKNLRNVNALAEGQRLPINQTVNGDLKLIQFFSEQRFKTDTPPIYFKLQPAMAVRQATA